MGRIFRSIVLKEFYHIWRDPQTLVIILLLPLLMLILFGYAITLEMRNIETVIIDRDHSPASRAFLDEVSSVDFFEIVARDIDDKEIETYFRKREARCVIIIPQRFEQSLKNAFSTPVQLIIDATDPNAANYIHNYLSQISMRFNLKQNPLAPVTFNIVPRLFYNPDMKSSYFFVPGLVAVILLLISTLLTSIAIVREKEMGTMEQILVSPVHPFQIILGKVIPYVAIGYLISLMILIVAHFWFLVPVAGSLWMLNLSLILYLLCGLSIGLFISTITDKQQIAMMVALMATVLPTVMMSGFIFPISSMPRVLQGVAAIIPATHFLTIIRGVMLKGTGLHELWPQTIILVGMSAFLLGLSVKKFKSTLE